MLRRSRKNDNRKILGSLIIGAVTGIVFGPAAGVLFGGLAYGLSHAADQETCAVLRRNFVPERVGGYRLSHRETKALKQANPTRSNIGEILHSGKVYGPTPSPFVRVSLRLNSLPSGSEKRVTSPKTLDEAIRRLIQA